MEVLGDSERHAGVLRGGFAVAASPQAADTESVRRLVLIVTCIAALGVGTAVWISGADATVAHKLARCRLRPAWCSRYRC